MRRLREPPFAVLKKSNRGAPRLQPSRIWSRQASKVFEDLVAQGGIGLRTLGLRGATPLEGGLPIIVDGKIIGAIGVSGATAVQDDQVAKAGADAAT
jgi:glc operon protein GlcG